MFLKWTNYLSSPGFEPGFGWRNLLPRSNTPCSHSGCLLLSFCRQHWDSLRRCGKGTSYFLFFIRAEKCCYLGNPSKIFITLMILCWSQQFPHHLVKSHMTSLTLTWLLLVCPRRWKEHWENWDWGRRGAARRRRKKVSLPRRSRRNNYLNYKGNRVCI